MQCYFEVTLTQRHLTFDTHTTGIRSKQKELGPVARVLCERLPDADARSRWLYCCCRMVRWLSSREWHHRVPIHSSCKCHQRLHRQLSVLSHCNNSPNLEAPARSPLELDCNSAAFPRRHCKRTYRSVRSSKCH